MKQRQQSVSSSNRVKKRKYILVYVPKIFFSASSFCVVCLTHWMWSADITAACQTVSTGCLFCFQVIQFMKHEKPKSPSSSWVPEGISGRGQRNTWPAWWRVSFAVKDNRQQRQTDRRRDRETDRRTDRCYMTVGPSVAQPVCLTELGELSLFEPGKVPGSVLISCCQDGFIMFAVLIFSQFFVSLRWFYFHFSASVLLIPLDVRFGSVTEVQSEYQISLSNVRTWMKLWANVVWRESFCTAGENMRSD